MMFKWMKQHISAFCYKKAVANYNDHNYPTAAHWFERTLNMLEPNERHPLAFTFYGFTLLKLGNLEHSKRILESSLFLLKGLEDQVLAQALTREIKHKLLIMNNPNLSDPQKQYHSYL